MRQFSRLTLDEGARNFGCYVFWVWRNRMFRTSGPVWIISACSSYHILDSRNKDRLGHEAGNFGARERISKNWRDRCRATAPVRRRQPLLWIISFRLAELAIYTLYVDLLVGRLEFALSESVALPDSRSCFCYTAELAALSRDTQQCTRNGLLRRICLLFSWNIISEDYIFEYKY